MDGSASETGNDANNDDAGEVPAADETDPLLIEISPGDAVVYFSSPLDDSPTDITTLDNLLFGSEDVVFWRGDGPLVVEFQNDIVPTVSAFGFKMANSMIFSFPDWVGVKAWDDSIDNW